MDENLEARAALLLMREVAAIPKPEHELQLSFLVPQLVERGLLIRRYGERDRTVTTSSEGDRLLEAIDAAGARMVAEFNSCPYTHSHTREWCGRDYCRDS